MHLEVDEMCLPACFLKLYAWEFFFHLLMSTFTFGLRMIDSLHKGYYWFRHLCLLLRKHKTGRTSYRSEWWSSPKKKKLTK